MLFAFSIFATATVGARSRTILADMQAMQMSLDNKDKVADWTAGTPGTNECPSGDIPITQDECEAFALMDSNPTLLSILSNTFPGGPTFPLSDPNYPKGCSIAYMGSIRTFYYNLHPVGAPQTMPPLTPACKSDTWVMYKSMCPAGKVTISTSECVDFANDKHHYVHSGDISSPGDPPGCFGRGGPALPTFGVDTSEVGKVYFNTHGTGAVNNPYAFPVCKDASTASPTSAPTTLGGQTSAVGDPHMTTIFGTRFDIMRAGPHALVHIPQGAIAADTLLRVQASVRHEGPECSDMYIKELNVTGSWAEGKRIGGFSFVTESPGAGQDVAPLVGSADWASLGMIDLKVVRGSTTSGVWYLNMYARHLRDTSKKYRIGGILGLESFLEAATPAAGCSPKVLSLLSSRDRDAA